MSDPLMPPPWANDKADLSSELVMQEIAEGHDCEYRSHLTHSQKHLEALQTQLQTCWDKLAEIREWANDRDWPKDEGEWQEPAYYHGIGYAQAHIVEILGGEE